MDQAMPPKKESCQQARVGAGICTRPWPRPPPHGAGALPAPCMHACMLALRIVQMAREEHVMHSEQPDALLSAHTCHRGALSRSRLARSSASGILLLSRHCPEHGECMARGRGPVYGLCPLACSGGSAAWAPMPQQSQPAGVGGGREKAAGPPIGSLGRLSCCSRGGLPPHRPPLIHP